MKIYKNPFVSRESYFVKTGKARTAKKEATASKGYSIEFFGGKWEVRECEYYDFSLRNEFPVVAENKASIKSIIERAILNAVLDLVGSAKMDGERNDNLIANGVTIQRWIPVTERLPEEDKLVLMLCKNGAMFVGYCGISWNNFERRWHIKTALNSTKLLNKGRVTHWMPLPQPPKGE